MKNVAQVSAALSAMDILKSVLFCGGCPLNVDSNIVGLAWTCTNSKLQKVCHSLAKELQQRKRKVLFGYGQLLLQGIRALAEKAVQCLTSAKAFLFHHVLKSISLARSHIAQHPNHIRNVNVPVQRLHWGPFMLQNLWFGNMHSQPQKFLEHELWPKDKFSCTLVTEPRIAGYSAMARTKRNTTY